MNSTKKKLPQKERRHLLDTMIEAVQQDDASRLMSLVDDLCGRISQSAAMKMIRLKKRHEKRLLQYIVEHAATQCLTALIEARLDLTMSLEPSDIAHAAFDNMSTEFVTTHLRHLVFYGYSPAVLLCGIFIQSKPEDVVATVREHKHLFLNQERHDFVTLALKYTLKLNLPAEPLYTIMRDLSWSMDTLLQYTPDNGDPKVATSFLNNITYNGQGTLARLFKMHEAGLISSACMSFCLQQRKRYQKTLGTGEDKYLPLYLEILSKHNRKAFHEILTAFFDKHGTEAGLHILSEETQLLSDHQGRSRIGIFLARQAYCAKTETVDEAALHYVLKYFEHEQNIIIPYVSLYPEILTILKRDYADTCFSFQSVVNLLDLFTKGWFSQKLSASLKESLRESMDAVNWLLSKCQWNEHIATSLIRESDPVDAWIAMIRHYTDKDNIIAIALLHMAIIRFGIAPVISATESTRAINHLLVCYSPMELLQEDMPSDIKSMLLSKIA